MSDVIEVIRGAITADATAEARTAGAQACRAILAALEPAPAVAPPAPIPPVAQIVAALRGAPPEHLLDLAISKLRAALPAGRELAPVKPINFQLVPVPRRG